MHDDRLDKLGTYFCHWNIGSRYAVTFERFIKMVNNGTWSEFISHGEQI